VTNWAVESLKSKLEQVQYTFPSSSPAPGAVVSTKAQGTTVTGHASVATVRGKKRYLYELCVKLEWQFDHEDQDAHGKLNIPDVDGTCLCRGRRIRCHQF
jgi:activator of HSP90 ATPase